MKNIGGRNFRDYEVFCMNMGYEDCCDACPLRKLCDAKPKDREKVDAWKNDMDKLAIENADFEF